MLTLFAGIIVIELAVIAIRVDSTARSTELLRRHYLDVVNVKQISIWVPDGYQPLGPDYTR